MAEKILLVDDDNEFRSELRSCLDSYDVIESKNGQEALLALSKPNEIGLIILDIRMPGLSGTEILKIAKKRSPGVKAIMLTAFSSKETAVESLRGQADEYLEKPVDIEKLKGTIEKLLDINKSHAEPGGSGEIKQKILRVKNYIDRNILKRVSLKDAAGLIGFSPKYLSRIFIENSGIGFKDYELKVKIKKAKELLKKTGDTVGQISDKLGFANPESFMRIFKKITKFTPTRYRKKH